MQFSTASRAAREPSDQGELDNNFRLLCQRPGRGKAQLVAATAGAAPQPRRLGAAVAAAVLVVLLLALAPTGARAQPSCSMKHCARCRVLQAQPGQPGWPGRSKICFLAKTGYLPAPNRASVPTCAAGYAAKKLKGSKCIKCAKGLFAPAAKIGSLICGKCPANTVLNVYSNRCVGLPGYIVNDDGTVRECSVDKFCINNVERDCPLGTNTNGQTAQSTCDFVDAGFFWTGTAAAACEEDTFSATVRRKTAAATCDACATGFSTATNTGQTSCGFNARGYSISLVGTTFIATPCAPDTFQASQLAITSLPKCQNCATGTNTNNATTQTACNFLSPGFGSDAGSNPLACAANTFRAGVTARVPSVSCVACSSATLGTGTNGTTGQASCNFILQGYFNGGTAAAPSVQPCAADSFTNTVRALSDTSPCKLCAPRFLSTNNNTAQADCFFAPPGFFYNAANATGSPCPAEQFSATFRNWSSDATAGGCTNCTTGLSTNGGTGQSVCLWVLPGYFFNSAVAVLCQQGTFSDTTRLRATATNCTACAMGTSTNTTGATSAAQCFFVAPGYFSVDGVNVLPCASNSFIATARPKTDLTTCATCPNGTSTNQAIAQPQCYFVFPGYGSTFGGINSAGVILRNPFLCGVNTARAGFLDTTGSTTSVTCPSCNPTPGLTTNQQQGQAQCLFTQAGYANNGTAAAPVPIACVAETFSPVDRSVADLTPCSSCAISNLGTNGATASTACRFVLAGFAYVAASNTGVACAADTVATLRAVASFDLPCTTCNAGTTTNQLTAQSACNFVKPGFFFASSTATSGTPCPATTFATGARNRTAGLACTSCGFGITTNVTDFSNGGATQQSQCAFIAPGFYNSPATNQITACEVNTFFPTARQLTDQSNCTACPPGTSTGGRTAQTSCTSLAAASTFFTQSLAGAPDAAAGGRGDCAGWELLRRRGGGAAAVPGKHFRVRAAGAVGGGQL